MIKTVTCLVILVTIFSSINTFAVFIGVKKASNSFIISEERKTRSDGIRLVWADISTKLDKEELDDISDMPKQGLTADKLAVDEPSQKHVFGIITSLVNEDRMRELMLERTRAMLDFFTPYNGREVNTEFCSELTEKSSSFAKKTAKDLLNKFKISNKEYIDLEAKAIETGLASSILEICRKFLNDRDATVIVERSYRKIDSLPPGSSLLLWDQSYN